MKTKLLIVEDDPHILLGLEEILRGEGHEVHTCTSGGDAVGAVKRAHPDLIVLDVMLPGKSGFDICRELRSSGLRSPILMLTAKGQEIDKVIGLDLGADDYVTKPFGVRELVARIKALLRRSGSSTSGNGDSFSVGDWTVNPRTFELSGANGTDSLTAKELRLLQYFHKHPGEVLSRDQLLNEVWGCGYFGTTRTLDQVIAQLRRKLGDTSPPRLLLTVHGVGYRLAASAG
ncbi:MAG TPA: DNA-binding response regulator [Verrucomicrobiales bacterium]|nr:DNA-binding response regulator [Verrucomicrobiales bacterium]